VCVTMPVAVLQGAIGFETFTAYHRCAFTPLKLAQYLENKFGAGLWSYFARWALNRPWSVSSHAVFRTTASTVAVHSGCLSLRTVPPVGESRLRGRQTPRCSFGWALVDSA
jgi:hypothetical protein